MYYLITIAKSQVKDYVSVRELQEIIHALELEHNISCIYGKWERHGKYKQLHYHGIFWLPTRTQYSRLTKLYDMHLHFSKCIKRDIPRIKRYIDKHFHPSIHTQLDTELANYFNNKYCF